MTQEDKEILLKDLCARLPYRVKCAQIDLTGQIGPIFTLYGLNGAQIFYPKYTNRGVSYDSIYVGNVKPYLRQMSSMTEEERKESREWLMLSFDREGNKYFDGFGNVSAADILKGIDWLNSHHFDYRGLIEKGLALKALEGMYKFE